MTSRSFIPTRLTLALLFGALALAGCSNVPMDSGKVPVETRTPGANKGGAGGADTAGGGQSSVATVDLSKSGAGDADSAAQRTVYFDFDSYVVKDDYRPLIERTAKALAADRKKHLQIEGHTDARGSSEYNLALGQRRAEAVERALALLGATSTQMEPVSFGKERPAVPGDDETAYAKNRRAELVYR